MRRGGPPRRRIAASDEATELRELSGDTTIAYITIATTDASITVLEAHDSEDAEAVVGEKRARDDEFSDPENDPWLDDSLAQAEERM